MEILKLNKMKVFNLIAVMLLCCYSLHGQTNVEMWQVYEVTLRGPSGGNPFVYIQLTCSFSNNKDTIAISGFYDGDGLYKIRFMPQKEGKWMYTTASNVKNLNKKSGSFVCTPAQRSNHGPVAVKDTFSFAYADETPYDPFGTTCYGWVHQGDSMANLTLKTLSGGYFNKMRMCIFPKSYDWTNNEPQYYPFEGKPLKDWNYSRLNPEFFRNIERRIQQLDTLGIEADLIVFHPYDRWGFSRLVCLMNAAMRVTFPGHGEI